MGKKYKIRFTDFALGQLGEMSPEDIRGIGEVIGEIAEHPERGEPVSHEEIRELIANGDLPEDFLD